MTLSRSRLIIGISGASGMIYGVRLLEILRQLPIESHLIISKAAQQVRAYETQLSNKDITALADVTYAIDDVACALASGSYQTLGMIIAPCSMNTLGQIAHGISSNALTRAADVTLKERRKLVLLTRETPLTAVHLQNMLAVTNMGGIIAPPVPAFYHQPQTIDDIVNHTLARILDLFDLPVSGVKRWGSTENCSSD